MTSRKSMPLTVTELLAAATDFLVRGGYARLEQQEESGGWPSTARLFEDAYGIVAAVVYESWSELLSDWPDEQERLVELISQHVRRTDPKAWDGYLVLLTPALLPSREDEARATAIRYDTSRLRKLLATGEDLQGLGEVQQVLTPLLPLGRGDDVIDRLSPLSTLPDLLVQRGVPEAAAHAVVDAFTRQESLMEALSQAVEDT